MLSRLEFHVWTAMAYMAFIAEWAKHWDLDTSVDVGRAAAAGQRHGCRLEFRVFHGNEYQYPCSATVYRIRSMRYLCRLVLDHYYHEGARQKGFLYP